MTDEQIEGTEAPAADAHQCAMCGVALTPSSTFSVSGHPACEKCVNQLEDEIAAKQAGATSMPMAVAGTLVGAVVAAAVWVGIVMSTNYEIGYVAVLVGYLAGKGAVLFTGGAHGRPLQVVAVAGAVFGLVLAKYAIFAHDLKEYAAEEYGEVLGYFDPQVTSLFIESLGETTGLFDLLWIFFAVTAAWRVPASPELEVTRA